MEVTDPRAIRALAHPVRLDLLELLVAIGPATAAQCGRILGVSQASCSFHLRQLAKYGLVVDAGPGQDRRERRWQMPDNRIRLPGNDGVTRQLFSVVVEREMQAILERAQRQDGDIAEWRGTEGPLAGVAVMSADEVTEVRRKITELLEPYFARAVSSGPRLPPGQRYVRYFLAGTPMPELDLKGDGDAPGDH
ncbi:MAG TPA: helix-turn-helix domain-containing protein [Streptosporangiaceae bacterium]|jgi:DNA-binding transcriptional ArsR family regulator|nr:helix-turn-helix domain-containing protein [Streptosporangiaceae bacterium]